ncbi:MAG TPA: hypothetical protein H9815_00190 [Candidatus Ruania gallistercoris]|uniref:PH domain-containing protein n=1 Tax=Candidatus Ruania gallistercoris TaxID=2838746 RepID=A0A9D2EBC1_9MICO|nr:hypothetical protein [Candidatus Ruania gallistercoris]
MSARRALRRHGDELGAPIAVHYSRPGVWTKVIAVAFWLLMPAAMLVNPDPDPRLNVAFPVLMGLLILGVYALIRGETLAVCERGLLIGSTAPFLRPYVLRYEEIVPGSLTPITGTRRITLSLGIPSKGLYRTIRSGAWIHQGIYLIGPPPLQPQFRRARILRITADSRPWIWFAGTGRTPPERVTAQIASAAHRAGFTQLAEGAVRAVPQHLNGSVAHSQDVLPGLTAGVRV